MFYFVANLKPYTFYRGRGNRRFDCYLLSVDYLKAYKNLAKEVRNEDRILCADNGNVDLIVKAINENSDKAASLHNDREKEESTLGHDARPGELSTNLTARYQALANEIFDSFKAIPGIQHIKNVLNSQSEMSPTYIVGMEELSIVTLTGLNIERQYTQFPLSWYKSSTEKALQLALDTKANKFGPKPGEVFAGLHAMDFDSAYQVGKLTAEAGIESIASGLVSAMKDRSYTDYRIVNGNLINLSRNVPRPYIRTMEIISGMHLGYAEHSNRQLRFHALGVGTPILLTMIGLFSRNSGFTSVDSTAPIKDAHGSRIIRLYVDSPAPRKLSTHKILEYWLSQDLGWTCQCPYCRGFNQRFPYDLNKARKWWKSEGERKLVKEDVRSGSPLAEFMPLMCYSKEKDIRRQAGLARIGHNHWLLKRMEKTIQEKSNDPRSMHAWVRSQMETYLSYSGSSPSWKASAEEAWKITDDAFKSLIS